MEYFIKASAILILFYLFYKLLLQKETFFQLNRFFLLGGLICSVVLPLIVIPIYVEIPATSFKDLDITYSTTSTTAETSIDWFQIITYLYIGGIIIYSSKLAISSYSLLKLFLNSSYIKKIDSISYIETTYTNSPFSIFNYIVYNPTMFTKDELEQIIDHEKVHIKQQHSIDVITSEIIKIIFWFNPFFWMYKKEIHQNLEYIADATAIKKTETTVNYQHLLLKTCFPNYQYSFTNKFYNSLIKKRITMLHKNRSNKINQWKLTLIIPILVAFVFTYNTKTIAQIVETNTDELLTTTENSQSFLITKDTEKIAEISEQYSSENLNFKNVEKDKLEKITSINISNHLDSPSTTYNTESKTIRKSEETKIISVDSTKTEKSKSYVKIGYQINNPVLYTPPTTSYNLGQIEPSSYQQIISSNNIRIAKTIKSDSLLQDRNNKPLIVIDGKVSFLGVEDLNPNRIGSMHVIEGKNATDKYGDKAKNGAILITMKKNEKIEVIGYGDRKSSKTVYIGHPIGEQELENKQIRIRGISSKNPLTIIDGQTTNKKLEDLNPDDIESIHVYKDGTGKDNYGEKGKDGVIEITTKKTYSTTIKLDKDVSPINSIVIVQGKDPIYIIDGEKSTKKEALKLSNANFESISALRGDEAIKKYGKKAKNGVLLITTKKN